MSRIIRSSLIVALAVGLTISIVPNTSQPVQANEIMNVETVFDTDFVSVGLGGLRGVGSGTIMLAGVSGTVTKAYLYWNGPSSIANPTLDIMFAGSPVTGTNIGISDENCWPFDHSDSFQADVTSLATGNGPYSISGLVQDGGLTEINGVSLVVFFDDGMAANNRDVVIFHGNDSNIANPFDALGWNVTLSGINYTSGTANMQLHVGDAQPACDDALVVNSVTIVPAGAIFEGASVPLGTSFFPGWDIMSFDVTSLLSPGPNTLTLTSGQCSDCLSLTVALVDLPAGAAPPTDDFDCCIQDDVTGSFLQWNSTTGAWKYTFCPSGEVATGTGNTGGTGCVKELSDPTPDFAYWTSLHARLDTCAKTGKVTIQRFPPRRAPIRLNDTNTDNNNCTSCTAPGKAAVPQSRGKTRLLPREGRLVPE
jgi:hypothetical protein